MAFELHPDLKRDGIVIGSFPLSLVLMINDKNYPWFVLVPKRAGIVDAYQLAEADHDQLARESRVFSTSLMATFKGRKMNVAALGNMTPQLHIHHIVRFENDPAWPGPIWGVKPLVPMSEGEVRNRINSLRREGADSLKFL